MAMTKEARSAAAKLGWQRRKARQAAEVAKKAKRSAAAKKGWETRREKERAREMLEEYEQQQEEQLYTEAQAIEDELTSILTSGEGGEHLARVMLDALESLKDEIGSDEYYKNLSDNAGLILDRAKKIVYKYENQEKVNHAQALYRAASGGRLMPDDIMIDVYDASNTARRAQYQMRNPTAKARGPYKKKR